MYLNCHSFHSLRYGTISVEELVQQAVDNNIKALALTDINTVTGIYDFYRLCLVNNIKPLVGVEIRNEDNRLYYITLAKNEKGIAEVNRMLTEHNCESVPIPEHNPDFKDSFVIYPLSCVPEKLLENEYIGIRPEELNQIITIKWKKLLHKMVILSPVTFRTKRQYNLHRILRAIDRNVVLSKVENTDICSQTEYMKPETQLLFYYKNFIPIIENTRHILEACNYKFDFSTSKNKLYYTDSQESDFELLKKLAHEGFAKIYGDNASARKRLERELKVINDLNFCGYFLITWDIVEYSNSQGLMHVGRG